MFIAKQSFILLNYILKYIFWIDLELILNDPFTPWLFKFM